MLGKLITFYKNQQILQKWANTFSSVVFFLIMKYFGHFHLMYFNLQYIENFVVALLEIACLINYSVTSLS